MYTALLHSHNLIRWILLILLIFVLFRAWTGWLGKGSYQKIDKITGGILVGFTHLQLIVGLLLYFVYSQVTKAAFQDMGAAMKDPNLRFYAVEHILTMIIAVVLIQLGRTFSKKAATDIEKHKKVAIYTTIALLLILSRMPNWNLM
jgi:uncharacterized membrane protein YozB (DUF420 family)